jgi:uncharacterized protein YlxW (UPF0749 family)
MVYQYRGLVTKEYEDEYKIRIEFLEASEQRAWEASQAAQQKAAELAAEKKKLQQAVQDTRKAKRNVQARLRRSTKENSSLRVRVEDLTPAGNTSFGGREGLEAACQEVARFEARRRQERRAA